MLVKFYKLLSKNISIVKRVEYREDINILRALAVISVVLYHAGFKFIPGGWLGVDLFFFISGYLISNKLILGLRKNKKYISLFFKKRFLRLTPALIRAPRLFLRIIVSLNSSLFIISIGISSLSISPD